MKNIFLSFIAFTFTQAIFADELSDLRAQLIVNAFNQQPEKIIRPLTVDDVHLGKTDGRVDVNEKAKLSYYIDIQEMGNKNSKMTLIPMATSRFTPTYYQTDEWWDAHAEEIKKAREEGLPTPKQDMNEVAAWLNEMKLTTNPDVLIINPTTGVTERIPLQEHLFNHYVQKYLKNGEITLFRGAEKLGEADAWKAGESPRGVRYWTPTANYAWRYARKNFNFFNDLIEGKTPLFVFKIPLNDFRNMVLRKWPRLTLGTELTKNAHSYFEHSGQFGDHLYSNQPYLGDGFLGVELELRSNRAGAQDMVRYFQRTATIDDLAEDRIQVLERTKARLSRKNPSQTEQINNNFNARIERIKYERDVVNAFLSQKPDSAVRKLLQSPLRDQQPELANIDGFDFEQWVESKMPERAKYQIKPEPQAKKEITEPSTAIKMCKGLFL